MIKRKELIHNLQDGDPEELLVVEIVSAKDILERAKDKEIDLTQEDAESILEDYSDDRDSMFCRCDPLDALIDNYCEE